MPAQYEQHVYEGVSIWFGRDEDGDLFVSINTEDADPGVNDEEGFPQIFVYLNDATLNDPKEVTRRHSARGFWERMRGVTHG